LAAIGEELGTGSRTPFSRSLDRLISKVRWPKALRVECGTWDSAPKNFLERGLDKREELPDIPGTSRLRRKEIAQFLPGIFR